jgi:hypothetical protein
MHTSRTSDGQTESGARVGPDARNRREAAGLAGSDREPAAGSDGAKPQPLPQALPKCPDCGASVLAPERCAGCVVKGGRVPFCTCGFSRYCDLPDVPRSGARAAWWAAC